MLMDMGLSPTLSRQVANARGQKDDFQPLLRLLKSFELIFVFLSILIILVITFSSNWLAANWIKSENLNHETLVYCIYLMAGMIALRWFTSLYRSGINGFEDQVWLNQVNVLFLFIKYFGALFLLVYFDADIQVFFEYQLLIGCIEPIILARRFYLNLPEPKISAHFYFDIAEVKKVMPFALGVFYSAVAWAFVTQTDRLILSGTLSLREFGYFTIITLISTGVTFISTPVGQALRPRLTVLLAEKDNVEFIKLYGNASSFVTWITFSVAIIVGLNSEVLLYAFTGDREAAAWGKGVLTLFALGNAFLSVGAFQYYLQIVFGDLSLHVKMTTVVALVQVPIISLAAIYYGAMGAGIAWFFLRLMFFLICTPLVHGKFLPSFHASWMLRRILPIIFVTSFVGFFLNYWFPLSVGDTRVLLVLKLAGMGLFQLFLTAFIIFYCNPEKLKKASGLRI